MLAVEEAEAEKEVPPLWQGACLDLKEPYSRKLTLHGNHWLFLSSWRSSAGPSDERSRVADSLMIREKVIFVVWVQASRYTL